MKRMIHALLAAAVLVSAMTCTAFATEEEQPTTNIDGVVEVKGEVEDEVYTATYNNASADRYVVLVVRGEGEVFDPSTALDPENILYINQTDEVKDGTVTFDILPKEVEDSFVVLGGEDQPVVLGKINKLTPPYVLGNVISDFDEETNEPIIDIEDALAILRYDVELVELDETQLLAANVNQDFDEETGEPIVDIEDALRILRYDVELISYEEMTAPAV